MSRRRINLGTLPLSWRYAIGLSVTSAVMLLAWRLRRVSPGPAWLSDYLLPACALGRRGSFVRICHPLPLQENVGILPSKRRKIAARAPASLNRRAGCGNEGAARLPDRRKVSRSFSSPWPVRRERTDSTLKVIRRPGGRRSRSEIFLIGSRGVLVGLEVRSSTLLISTISV